MRNRLRDITPARVTLKSGWALLLIAATVFGTGCASAPSQQLAFSVEREAPPPSGYQQALLAKRIAVL